MLCLDMREGDYFLLGNNTRVTVTRVIDGGRSVAVVIEAPKDVPIVRKKVLERGLAGVGR